MDYFEKVNETGVIRLVNIVPDFGDDSCQLTEYLTKKGISVGAGHTDATFNQFQQAMAKGLKYCIHFLNGPISGSFKQFNGGGGIEAVLRGSIYAEMIMDGVHIAPWYILDVLNRKGADRIMAISDAMFSSQADGVRDFSINGINGRVDDSGRYVYVVGREKLTLFSSVLTMDVAFSNLVSWLTVDMEGAWTPMHKAKTLNDAITIAGKCCSTNIARMLKWQGGDDLESGEITNGKWVDFVVGKITGQPGNYKLDVKKVYVRGVKVYDAGQKQ
jgi:N-acetylglucosamine-6-phosphate deacetylase